MPAKDLGTKHLCFKCGTKFYDLKKAEPICPKCGADQRQSPALKAPAAEKRSRPPARPAAPPPPIEEPETAAEPDEDVEPDEDDEDDDEDDEP
jgi:predicted  nucleic acid-binding Zn-ribbon protein